MIFSSGNTSVIMVWNCFLWLKTVSSLSVNRQKCISNSIFSKNDRKIYIYKKSLMTPRSKTFVFTVSTSQTNFLIYSEAADSNLYIWKCFQMYKILTSFTTSEYNRKFVWVSANSVRSTYTNISEKSRFVVKQLFKK